MGLCVVRERRWAWRGNDTWWRPSRCGGRERGQQRTALRSQWDWRASFLHSASGLSFTSVAPQILPILPLLCHARPRMARHWMDDRKPDSRIDPRETQPLPTGTAATLEAMPMDQESTSLDVQLPAALQQARIASLGGFTERYQQRL